MPVMLAMHPPRHMQPLIERCDGLTKGQPRTAGIPPFLGQQPRLGCIRFSVPPRKCCCGNWHPPVGMPVIVRPLQDEKPSLPWGFNVGFDECPLQDKKPRCAGGLADPRTVLPVVLCYLFGQAALGNRWPSCLEGKLFVLLQLHKECSQPL